MPPKKKITRKKSVTKKPTTNKIPPKSSRRAAQIQSGATEDPCIDRLKTLIKLLEKSDLNELEYEDKDIRVNLRQGYVSPIAAERPTTIATPGAIPVLAPASAPIENVANENTDDLHVVCSPFVGTFYTSPAPDASPYTGIGQSVSKGQTVCIVEAMKLMNEIESEVDGVVIEVLAKNSEGVQYGDPLLKIKVG